MKIERDPRVGHGSQGGGEEQNLQGHYFGTALNSVSNMKKLHNTIWCFITQSNISDLQPR